MSNYKKIVGKDLDAITKTDKTFKDIYNVMLSHRDLIAYERLVDFELEAVTYERQDLDIRAFAAYIRSTYPHAANEYIGIDLANSPSYLMAFWGVLMSGNKPYLINSFYPAKLKLSLVKRLDIKLVITNAADYVGFTVVNVDTFDKKCPQITDALWQNEFAISSSLTGLDAKICVFDGETVVNQLLNTKDIIKTNACLMNDYQKRIKVAMILPLFHVFGIIASYFWFAFFGRTVVFLKDNSPDTIRGTVNRHKVTHIFAPPILFHQLYKGIKQGVSQENEKRKKKFQRGIKLAFVLQNIFPSLGVAVSKRLFKDVLAASFGMSPRFMVSGGAFIDGDALKIINAIGYPLFNGYGTTETAVTGGNFAKKISKRTDGSIGKPFKNISYTYDSDETLIVAGNSLCKRIIWAEGEESGFNSIKTNDLVKRIDGGIFIDGRKSDLFIGQNGENISPDTLQNELEVKKANRFCVLELDGKLSVVLEYDEKLPTAIIADEIERVKNALAKITYGHIVSGIFVTYRPIASPDAIKVSRALLRKRIADGEIVLLDCKKMNGADKEQNSSTDDTTMTLIKDAFKHAASTGTEILATSNFFTDLGGDSLGYFSLICELESIFNIHINLEKNTDLRTPECFYKCIKEAIWA
ncbi:MAG: AMP-binding protein [Clostridiales bacterium]|jgi:long-subunit acyl-CoA synthetase (AMP-forming)|nr:AMP-binding protein [Clostridiales bacterium]